MLFVVCWYMLRGFQIVYLARGIQLRQCMAIDKINILLYLVVLVASTAAYVLGFVMQVTHGRTAPSE